MRSYPFEGKSPFILEIHPRRGACTRKAAIARDKLFTWEITLLGRITFVYQTFAPLTILRLAFPPLKPQSAIRFPSLRTIRKPQLPGCLLSLISLWHSPMCVHNLKIFFPSVNLSFITGGSQPRTQKGRRKINFPPPQSNEVIYWFIALSSCEKIGKSYWCRNA